MVRHYSKNSDIYSVDMMFAYLNIFGHTIQEIEISKLHRNLGYKSWGDPVKKIFYSPLMVLKDKEKYEKDFKRIENADLEYPIIVTNNDEIIDGVHRLTKAHLKNIKTIKAYVFDEKLMKKFLIDDKGDWKKIDKIEVYNYIELFYKRFKK
jgi:disulfide oxidoreductase YuzD